MKRKRKIQIIQNSTKDPTSMNYCICQDMIEDGLDMTETRYKSKSYKGFRLYQIYGKWDLEFQDNIYNRVEIIYCPFCGKKLNDYDSAVTDKYEAFKSLKW